MTGIMIFRPHLDRCRRLAVCHRGRRPSGNSLLLLSLRPQNYPAGGGPAPDYPCIGPAGHHHGLSGGGQTDRHHRSGLILPAAHCTKYLPRPEPSSRLPGGSRERHGHVPDAASAPGGNALATPILFTGIRIAAVNAVGTAVFAAFVGGGGLGSVINTGIRQDDMAAILGGTGVLMLMALVLDTLMGLIEHRMNHHTAGSTSHRFRMVKRLGAAGLAVCVIAVGAWSFIPQDENGIVLYQENSRKSNSSTA